MTQWHHGWFLKITCYSNLVSLKSQKLVKCTWGLKLLESQIDILNIKIHICIFNLANLFFIVCKFIHLGMTRMGSECPNALPSISGWGSLLLTVACVRSGQSWTPGTA